jgi:hypothetical protein
MRLFSILLSMLLSVPALAGEYSVKTKVHTDAIQNQAMNKPASDEIHEQWIGDGQLANITPKQAFIVDQKANKIYIVNRQAKTYVESPIPLDMKRLLPPQMASMFAQMKIGVSVAPTQETKQIGKWACKAYDVNMTATMGMPMKLRVWATKDVPFDIAKYQSLYSHFLKTGFFDEAAVAEMNKVDGFQVATELTADMMGTRIHSTSELIEISAKPAPPGTFAPPAGFTRKDKLAATDLQK